MTLTFAGTLDRRAVVEAADLVRALAARPEVADAWRRESSCVGMSVGGLTWHLVGQPASVVRLVGATDEGVDAETIGLLDHYGRAAWVREDHEGETNRAIREGSDAQAAQGPEEAVAQLDGARGELEGALASAPATTYIPWQGWRLPTDDFLVTRLMEMVVHCDDLATSVGVPVPEFGSAVLQPVLGLLTSLAVRRHGQDALVRALSRPERAPSRISAF
jgi:hypothetical protein